jgi:chitin disaccharide deacetylase
MANGLAFDHAVRLACSAPGLGVGVHIVVLDGRALAPKDQIGGLFGANGLLPPNLKSLLAKIATRRVLLHHLQAEMRAQISRVISSGIRPTHLDTHKHSHIHPLVMKALAGVAKEFGIVKVRLPFENASQLIAQLGRTRVSSLGRRTFILASRGSRPSFRRAMRDADLLAPDHFFGFLATGQLARDALVRIIRSLPEGTSELVCHPGRYDMELEAQHTRLKQSREVEFQALRDPGVKQEIVQSGVQLASYRELQ